MNGPVGTRRILVLGASGYVGGRLVPRLLADGHVVRCLTRSPERLSGREWLNDTEVVEGDLLDPDTLDAAFAGVDTVFYLVHSLDSGEGFEERERQAAVNARRAAATAGVDHLVYLGGLGDDDDDNLSAHLGSRHTVGRELAAGAVAVTELRAAVILGSGSASFEMLRGLVEVLPIMTTPKWVQRTRCQPIAISDVLDRLVAVVGRPDLRGVWEIGGRDVVTYEELMHAYARVAGLTRRRVFPLPFVTPALSTHWVDLVTSLPSALARQLVGSLQNDVVVGDRPLDAVLTLDSLGVDEAIANAIAAIEDLDIPTRWTPRTTKPAARPQPWDPSWAGGTVLTDDRSATSEADAQTLMACVKRIGGDNGWYGFAPLWMARGLMDEVAGGAGWRRGRRHPTDLVVGDTVDVFTVERVDADMVRLRADMRMPGHGWLEWSVSDVDDGVQLRQVARFVPRGVAGRLYWAALVPFHALVFRAMVHRIARAADDEYRSAPPASADPTGLPRHRAG